MLEQACNNVRAVESGQKGVLKLGATMYASYSVVPHVAMQHRDTYSDVELHFQEMVPSDLRRITGWQIRRGNQLLRDGHSGNSFTGALA
jgi:DNA-binding transcriptional LysR family regulator